MLSMMRSSPSRAAKTASMMRIWPTALSASSSAAIRPSSRSLSGKAMMNAWSGPMDMGVSFRWVMTGWGHCTTGRGAVRDVAGPGRGRHRSECFIFSAMRSATMTQPR